MSNLTPGASKYVPGGLNVKTVSERLGYEMRVQSKSVKKVMLVFGFIHVKWSKITSKFYM
jgi:hypothetical protein